MTTVEQVTLAEVKVRLAIAGSRLREALAQLNELTSDEAFASGLEDHELMNLQDGMRRLEREVKYVDEVFKAKEQKLRRSKPRVKHA